MHDSPSQETEGWVGQFCSGWVWVSLRRGLPMKVQTQGILWSWENRGNGLFTFLGGGASMQQVDSRRRRQVGHKDAHTISLKTGAVYNRETFAAYVSHNILVLNWEKGLEGREKKKPCRGWMTEGQRAKRYGSLCQMHILTIPGHTVQGDQLNQQFTLSLSLLPQDPISMQDN